MEDNITIDSLGLEVALKMLHNKYPNIGLTDVLYINQLFFAFGSVENTGKMKTSQYTMCVIEPFGDGVVYHNSNCIDTKAIGTKHYNIMGVKTNYSNKLQHQLLRMDWDSE